MSAITNNLTAAIRGVVTTPNLSEEDFALNIINLINLIDIYGKQAVDEFFANPERYFLYN
jgi:hypothetical protein